jgi:DMSO reductase anchor subunit
VHPAPSILLFTTLSGAGYGLLAVWSLAGLAWLVPAEPLAGALGLGLALAFVTAGLLASTFHLGRPERAWRAVGQWRTSWLSREGVAALATYPPALLLAALWVLGGRIATLPALLAVLGAAVTVACTGQIYATLRPIPRWHQPLTTPAYLALALAAGALLALLLAGVLGPVPGALGGLVLLALPVAWGLKLLWWRAGDAAEPIATADAAIGLPGRGPVRLVEPPHSASNYLLDEMGYRVARRHAARLRRLALLLGLALPWALVAAGLALGGAALLVAAFVAALSLALAIAIERWLFFAEARHTVTLWYGEAAV